MPFQDWHSPADEARFLRTVLDHVSDCLVAIDTQGRIVLINKPYCRLLGGEEGDFLGQDITEVVSPKTRLHLVARGEPAQIGFPLKVRGQQLITKQVPVFQEQEIVGALGFALFSDFDALRSTFTKLSQGRLAFSKSGGSWAAEHSIDDILGSCPTIEALREKIRIAAGNRLPVLIHGETGTGKELAAQAIHRLSDRSGGPFVWTNCASIPEELIESELFGYDAGAFTGARPRGKPGKFELAKGGTLFLDEIGDMPLQLQASLLRALQSNEIVRVGGTAPVGIDVRIICATNRSLPALVKQGRFREDLFYRLDVLRINTPALRDRSDRPALINTLLQKLCSEHGLRFRAPDAKQERKLLRHDWPGNVRELESALLRFLIAGELDFHATAAPESRPETDNLKNRLQQEKARIFKEVLEKTGFDKNLAADLLGISRAQFYRELSRQAAPKPASGSRTRNRRR
jgi:transcriptional regulator with PAS, ATPase and Fis domain